MHIELVVTHCFKCCDNPRHVFRKTTGHYCVDCNFLNSEFNQVGRCNCNHVLWVTSSSCQHSQYTFTCWRDNRKAICPSARIHCFEFIFSIREFNSARDNRRVGELGTQLVDDVWVNAHRTTTGPHGRKICSEFWNFSDALPVRCQPTECSVNFFSVHNLDQRGNRIDVVVPGDCQIRIVNGRY